jgi:hypothetical protein
MERFQARLKISQMVSLSHTKSICGDWREKQNQWSPIRDAIVQLDRAHFPLGIPASRATGRGSRGNRRNHRWQNWIMQDLPDHMCGLSKSRNIHLEFVRVVQNVTLTSWPLSQNSSGRGFRTSGIYSFQINCGWWMEVMALNSAEIRAPPGALFVTIAQKVS